MLPRKPREIITAHRFDPTRRELYVEGATDQAFLTSLVGRRKHPDARVLSIDSVDLPGTGQGGNRARLLRFAAEIESLELGIRYFADADIDGVKGAAGLPTNGWLTDGWDVEGYVFESACFGKLLRFLPGYTVSDVDLLRASVVAVGRAVSAIRLAAHEEGLALPFQRMRLGRSITVDKASIEFDRSHYIKVLFDKVPLGVAGIPAFESIVNSCESMMKGKPDISVMHGHDLEDTLDAVLRKIAPAAVTSIVLRSGFEDHMAHEYPNLTAALSFLT